MKYYTGVQGLALQFDCKLDAAKHLLSEFLDHHSERELKRVTDLGEWGMVRADSLSEDRILALASFITNNYDNYGYYEGNLEEIIGD